MSDNVLSKLLNELVEKWKDARLGEYLSLFRNKLINSIIQLRAWLLDSIYHMT